MNKHKVHFSSESEDWSTPQDFFDYCNKIWGPFDLDVCASKKNAKSTHYFDKESNGLNVSWNHPNWFKGPVTKANCWMNPPYGREINKWVKKASEESLNSSSVCALLPARTDTKWFHEYVIPYADVFLLKGRLEFINSDGKTGTAPFPSMIAHYHLNVGCLIKPLDWKNDKP